MSASEDILKIEHQEAVLRFKKFDEADAWALGAQMRESAAARKLTLVINIHLGNRQMFYACMPGTSPDNETWVKRKINSVMRFHKSSYRLGRETAAKGGGFDASRGIDLSEYTNAGGSFPIHIIGTGVVGTITVSGIPQRDDHGFVVEAIATYLNVKYSDLSLPTEAE
jgi:uncharacterized protein (UPF0303 family)